MWLGGNSVLGCFLNRPSNPDVVLAVESSLSSSIHSKAHHPATTIGLENVPTGNRTGTVLLQQLIAVSLPLASYSTTPPLTHLPLTTAFQADVLFGSTCHLDPDLRPPRRSHLHTEQNRGEGSLGGIKQKGKKKKQY